MMTDFHYELSLLYCLLLNGAVFASAWFFARRKITVSRSQAVLDAALIGYAVQYISIGVPGLLGCLTYFSVLFVGMCCCISLVVAAWKTKSKTLCEIPKNDRYIVGGAVFFTVGFVLAFAHRQSDLPPISNDAMTYHFPAAVQWMQRGRIGLFQTWFFNPSNTYSPLAGSTFILWLIFPFHSDVLARFVEVPALLCVGLAIYQLSRQVNVRLTVAAIVATAAVLCRPLFLPCMMGKDDLFVAFFLIASLVALSKDRASERWGTVRFGISLGLLLATKYTALLTVPILLFALDGPKWSIKKWVVAGSTALLLGGSWYLRNWMTTGNPIFPLGSLFTAARSDAFHSVHGALNAVIEGPYGLPLCTAVLITSSLVISAIFSKKKPILRACSIGSMFAIALFFWRSPFPEVRFLLPVFALAFACIAFWIERVFEDERFAIIAGLVVLGSSIGTLFPKLFLEIAVPFAAVGIILAAIGLGAMGWAGLNQKRRMIVVGIISIAFFVFAYVNWAAFCVYQRHTRFVDEAAYSEEYPDLTRLWNFVDQHIPVDATVAYSNLYFTYPLQGGSLRRQLVYVPTRRGVKSVADLGWLGTHLSGEQLVPAAIRATVDSPNRMVWLNNLKKSNVQYLVIGRSAFTDAPAEALFAETDRVNFKLLFKSPAGWIYQFQPVTRT